MFIAEWEPSLDANKDGAVAGASAAEMATDLRLRMDGLKNKKSPEYRALSREYREKRILAIAASKRKSDSSHKKTKRKQPPVDTSAAASAAASSHKKTKRRKKASSASAGTPAGSGGAKSYSQRSVELDELIKSVGQKIKDAKLKLQRFQRRLLSPLSSRMLLSALSHDSLLKMNELYLKIRELQESQIHMLRESCDLKGIDWRR